MEAAFFGRSCRTVSNFPRFKVDQKKIRGTKYKIRCKIKISPFVCKHFHSRDSYFSSCPHYRLCMYVRINLYKLQRNIYKYTYITCMRANLYLYIKLLFISEGTTDPDILCVAYMRPQSICTSIEEHLSFEMDYSSFIWFETRFPNMNVESGCYLLSTANQLLPMTLAILSRSYRQSKIQHRYAYRKDFVSRLTIISIVYIFLRDN